MNILTDRLRITCFSPDMARDVHLNSLDADVRRFVPDEVFETEEDACKAVSALIAAYDGSEGPYVHPSLLMDGTNIGYVQLVKTDAGWEIGYHIAKPYTGCGYAAEAVRAFLPEIMKRMALNRVLGVCLAENAASRWVLEKCGFTLFYEGMGPYQGYQRQICKYLYHL